MGQVPREHLARRHRDRAASLRIEDLQRFVAPEWLFEQSLLLKLLTWATLAFEASFIVLVWPRRLRLWVLGAGVLLHLGIDLFLDIGFFSLAIFLAYLAFLPQDIADRWWPGSTARVSEPAGGEPAPDALAIQPAEQHRDRSGVVAEAVAGAVHDPQLGVAVGVDEHPGVEHGHEVVVAAVHDEQRAGRQSTGAGDRS